MNIRPKDLLLMYVVGAISMIAYGTLLQLLPAIGASPLLAMLAFVLFLLIPGGYYFANEEGGIKDAAIVSLLFGITFFPIFFIVILLPLSLLEGALFGFTPDFSSVMAIVQTSWQSLLFELLILGLVVAIMSLTSYSIMKAYRKAKGKRR